MRGYLRHVGEYYPTAPTLLLDIGIAETIVSARRAVSERAIINHCVCPGRPKYARTSFHRGKCSRRQQFTADILHKLAVSRTLVCDCNPFRVC
jgi:hypothetical protein